MTVLPKIDWARGDHFGLDLPAHPEALRAAGPAFLTRAFRAAGSLGEDNAIVAITGFDEWMVGGTGPKVMLSVAYAHDEPGLAHDLFVKFSRCFEERGRDAGRHHMEPEVRLALASRDPAFPVAVPRCYYADYQADSGTGVLITERLHYGQGRNEPHHHKCMDHLLPNPIAHYRVLIATVAHLSGTHKAGRLGPEVERHFPLDLAGLIAGRRNRHDAQSLAARARRLADFIARYPHLAPAHIADPAFLEGFCADAPLLIRQQEALARFHYSQPDMIALCHWNANIDNAWFWREPDGTLQCGLIDWGSVGQMHVSQTIWGCVGASEPEMLDRHFDELIELFITEYARSGGPRLDKGELTQQIEIHAMMSGLSAMLSSPPLILREVPDPDLVADRFDPVFAINETARVQLKISISFLNLWHRRDFGRWLRADDFRSVYRPAPA